MKYLLLFFGLLSYCITANSNPTPLTFEDYAKLPEKSMMVVSPSGRNIAYRLTNGEKDYLMIVDVFENKVLRAVDVADINPRSLYFVGEERIILVASETTRVVGLGGRYVASVALSYNLKDGKFHQLLTAGKGVSRQQAALGNVVGISSDGKYA